ncbi:MAG: heavy metal translocating P-type ATPase, partial [Lachnospiraceae bacterium]|nr:heavy metal translocating P-type ATPase [Lachnospiraceae bacterium]
MKQEVYKISGMSCAACSSAVERVTRRMEGVARSDVNLTTAKMQIEYDETLVTPELIIAKIGKAGFDAEIYVDDKEKRKREEAAQEEEWKAAKKRVILAIFFAVPLLYLSMGHMMPIPLPLPAFLDMEQHPMAFALAQLIFTVPILIFGRNFYLHGFPALFKGNPNMDSLVAIGTMAAFLYSFVMTVLIWKDAHHVHQLYYESAAVVVTLVMLGKYMEKRSKGKTSEAIKKLIALAPDTAILLKEEKEQEVMVEDLVPGDVIVLRAGSRVPLDGIVVFGNGSVDESMLTGESLPVEKSEGSEIIGGSLNYDGLLHVRVTRTGSDTTLAKIVQLMEDAQGKKAPISKLADKV